MALHISRFDVNSSFLPRLSIFAVLIASATATYLLLAWTMRCHELSELYGIATNREAQAATLTGLSQES